MTPEQIASQTTLLVALLTRHRPDLAAAFDLTELRSAAADVILSGRRRDKPSVSEAD